MESADDWALSKNQRASSASDLDAGETRLYRAFRHFWHPVAYSHDLGARPTRVVLCGHQLVVVRLDGEVRAFNDLCAHRGTALSLGTVVRGSRGEELRCPYHGWQYDRDGKCALAPQRPELAGHLRARIKRYNCCERYGLIWVCLADTPLFPIPEFPQWEDPAYAKIFIPSDDWACSAPRRTENYTDLGHFAIVHDGLLGDTNHARPPAHEVWRDGRALRMRALEPKLEPGKAKYGIEPEPGSDGLVETQQQWWIYMPLTVTFDQVAPGDLHWVLFFHPTPVGPKTTRNFTIAARNFGDPETAADATIEFTRLVYRQDQPIVESQRPAALPEDSTEEINLMGVDTLSAQYRKWLHELADELVSSEQRVSTL